MTGLANRWTGTGRSSTTDSRTAGAEAARVALADRGDIAGEIARTSGTSGFHNQTLVVLAVG